ncbi:hypothetical protein PInf_019156 [Phytophthora infestans]|nr:hypothetical protein PInf_019156 [Phytophthora infestans]
MRRGQELLSKGSDKENFEALEATKAYFKHYPEIVIQRLGLQSCQATVIGDAMLRGVSGDERKRVTTGKMDVANTLRKNVVIALLQPSPEVISLFDDVMILNENDLMYNGPCNQVQEYFASLGFSCPPERNIADYMLDLGTAEQRHYEALNFATKRPRRASEFADIFKCSRIHQEMLSVLEAPHAPELLRVTSDNIASMLVFHQGSVAGTVTLLRRQLIKFDPTQIAIVMGVIFLAILFLSMGQSSQIPTYMAEWSPVPFDVCVYNGSDY